MKLVINLLILFWASGIGNAQERYLDSIFSDLKVQTFTYSDTLQLDFYNAEKDTVRNKPLLLLVHGGGFSIGKRDNPLEKKFCSNLAKRGYAVASMSYRLLRKGKGFGCDCPALEKINTFLEVTKDVLKASWFLSNKSDELGFDGDKIVLIGSSAGAEAVLNTAFMRHRHDFKSMPYMDLKFAGIVSFSGAVIDADYITAENAVPTLMFHGKKDRLVPFGNASHHFCPSSKTGYLVLDGSGSIADRLTELGISYQLIYDPEGNHDWANLPYNRADIVSEFLKKTVMEAEHIQSRIKINGSE